MFEGIICQRILNDLILHWYMAQSGHITNETGHKIFHSRMRRSVRSQ
ncbi:hypothetical protein HVPorG_01696 [Roseomonas mucosa]|nr:hypothetical protein HVPorG_01696 [Roseomonas mucosa]